MAESKPPITPNVNKIEVAILEDNATLVKGMKAELDKPDFSVSVVSDNIEQFLHGVKSCQPQIAIVDLRIWKDLDAGFTAIERAREISPTTLYIIYTAYDIIENFHQGINLGIRAFVSKNIYEKPLDEVVRIVFHGGTYYGDFLSLYLDKLEESAVDLKFDRNEKEQGREGLSRKELEIINLLDNGLSLEQIAEKLVVSPNTVRAHTKSIRRKLHTKTTIEAIRVFRLHKKDQ